MHAWNWCGGLKENILYHFIGGQTHFSTFWHAEMSLAFNVQSSTLTPSLYQQVTEYEKFVCKTINSKPSL